MARLQTRDALVELVRNQFDLVTFSTSTNPTLAAVLSFLNESLQSMYALQMECYGDDYFSQSLSLLTQPDVGSTSLPADFAKLKKIFWRKDASTAVPVGRSSVDDLGLSTLTSCDWVAPRCALTGSAIMWAPVPSQQYIVDIWYAGIPADLASGSDTVNVGPGWVQWLVFDVCVKIARRLRNAEDLTFFAQMRDKAEAAMRDQAGSRMEADAPQVRSVTRPRRMHEEWEF